MGVYERKGHSKFWWLYLEGTGERIRTDFVIGESSAARKDSKALAVAEYHQRMNRAGAQRHGIWTPPETEAVTFKTFAAWYDQHKIAHNAGAERERGILTKHLLPFFGANYLADINPDRVAAYHTFRKRFPTVVQHFGGGGGKQRALKPPCHNTINREVALLKAMLVAAVPTHLPKSPLEGMKLLKTSDRPIVRREMTEAEFDRLFATLDVWDQAILLIGRDALVRLTNILDLKKTDHEIDDDGRHFLVIRKPKTGKPYRVRLSDRIVALLDVQPKSASEYLFPHRRGAETARDRRNGFTHALRRKAAAVKVPWGRDSGGNTFHWATRTSGSTRMLDHGGEGVIDAVTQMGGWASPVMLLEIYKQTRARHLDAIVDRLNAADVAAAKATGQKGRQTRQGPAGTTNAGRGKGQVRSTTTTRLPQSGDRRRRGLKLAQVSGAPTVHRRGPKR